MAEIGELLGRARCAGPRRHRRAHRHHRHRQGCADLHRRGGARQPHGARHRDAQGLPAAARSRRARRWSTPDTVGRRRREGRQPRHRRRHQPADAGQRAQPDRPEAATASSPSCRRSSRPARCRRTWWCNDRAPPQHCADGRDGLRGHRRVRALARSLRCRSSRRHCAAHSRAGSRWSLRPSRRVAVPRPIAPSAPAQAATAAARRSRPSCAHAQLAAAAEAAPPPTPRRAPPRRRSRAEPPSRAAHRARRSNTASTSPMRRPMRASPGRRRRSPTSSRSSRSASRCSRPRPPNIRSGSTRRDEFSKKAQENLVRIYSRMRPDAAAPQLAGHGRGDRRRRAHQARSAHRQRRSSTRWSRPRPRASPPSSAVPPSAPDRQAADGRAGGRDHDASVRSSSLAAAAARRLRRPDPRTSAREPHLTPVGAGLRPDRVPILSEPRAASAPIGRGNSFWQDTSADLFRDPRAMRVGDVVTVKISIKDKASLDNTSERSRDSKRNLNFDTNYDLNTAVHEGHGRRQARRQRQLRARPPRARARSPAPRASSCWWRPWSPTCCRTATW